MKIFLGKVVVLVACLLWSLGVSAAALVPAVNSPMLSMAGGTAPSFIWIPTATQTIGTSDTSCFSATGQGPGQTITPSTNPVAPYVGNMFNLYCQGVFTAPAVNTATVTAKVKWGSTVVASVTSSALASSVTNGQWQFQALCEVITISATPSASTVMCGGTFQFASGLVGAALTVNGFQSLTPVSVDTTAAFKPDLTLLLSTTAGGQAMTSLMAYDQIQF